MMPLSLLASPPTVSRLLIPVVALALLIAFGVGSCAYGYNKGAGSIQATWDREKVAQQAKQMAQQAKIIDTERRWHNELQQAQDQLSAAKASTQAEVDSTLADIRADNLQLRDRFKACQRSRMPADPAAAGGNSEASEGGLSKSDEEFLVLLAGEADQVVAQLTACQFAQSLQPGG